jgi:cysteine/histidine-rich domain-containing protein 1
MIFLVLEKCQFHPGAPIFHDAYKGWSCCNKKSTDFTEFLNFKGCKLGKHSHEKPPEPEKLKAEDIEVEQPQQKKPIARSQVTTRPSFESPCTKLVPDISASFKQQMDQIDMTKMMKATGINGEIAMGTSCKNGGCKASYQSPASNDEPCIHHPGFPIFHEGYKFWTCCQKKTSDFQTFLEQAGCETSKHKWLQQGTADRVNCRWDWHQTAGNVVVAVYAKNYDYKKSFVKVSPIRLAVKIVFPQENNAEFNIDLELRGMIDVERAAAKMYGTKIEMTLPKSEGGHWVRLDYPRDDAAGKDKEPEIEEPTVEEESNESDVDLDDLEIVQGAKITELASQKVD